MVATTTTTNISNNYEKLSKMANMMDVTADSIKPEESFYDKSMENNDVITAKPTLHIESENKSVKSNDLDSFNSYDGTVHEVVPVSYIVESKNTTSTEGLKQSSPEKEVIVIEDDDEEENEKNIENDKAPLHAENKDDVDNDDHEHRARQLNQKFGSFKFVKKTNSITLKNENGSFRLNVPAKSKHSATPSVASGQTASVSDYAINTPIMSEQSTFSYNQDNSKPRRRLNIDRQPTIKTIASNPSSIEPDYVVDSNHHNSHDSKRKPDRMETIEIKPTIPARSRNRPSSTVYSGDNHSKQNSLSSKFSNSSPSKYKRASLDFMQEQLGEQMEELKSIVSQQSDNEDEIQIKKEPENEHIDVSDFKAEINAQGQPNFGNSSPDKSSSRATPVTSNGFDEDDFYSAASDFADVESPTVAGNKQFVGNLNKRESVALDDSYLNRPIPNIPQNSNKKKVVNDEDDDEYEDIGYVTKSPTKLDRSLSKMSRNSIRIGRSKVSGLTSPVRPGNDTTVGINATSKESNNKRKEIRSSFDIDTLAQLLSVTKGTMIGSEFADLGMKSEEKIALEKLVDSLSRLTSDMILDPERYEEGLKRLKKATRALEGF